VEYLTEQRAKGKKLLDDVFNQKFGKEATNKMDWIGTVKGQANNIFPEQ
jgi:hypothetical protein